MNVIALESFKKDLQKITDKVTRQKIKKAILKAEKAPTLNKITNLKSVKGNKFAYRLRAGDYRIGVLVMKNTIELVCVAHRKDIYKMFP